MTKFIITEEERSRILGMHKSATSRQYLMEQSGTTQTTIGGGSAPAVMSIPDYNKFIVFNPSSGLYRFEALPFRPTMVSYLGGENSYLSGIIGKTILITQKTTTTYDKMERFALPNNSVDGVILGSFVPKAWYYGAHAARIGDGNSEFLYFFNKEITTNYSGNIDLPIIENGELVDLEFETPKANLVVSTVGHSASSNAVELSNNRKDIVKALKIKNLKPGTDYIRIRTYDGYCPEYKGYADYLLFVGIPALGSMAGVTKIT